MAHPSYIYNPVSVGGNIEHEVMRENDYEFRVDKDLESGLFDFS
jgi:hypothetical protein